VTSPGESAGQPHLDSASDNIRHLRGRFDVNLRSQRQRALRVGSQPSDSSWQSIHRLSRFDRPSKPARATASSPVGMQSGEKPFPGFTSTSPPGVEQSARVSLVYPLIARTWPLTQCCSGLFSSPSCVSAKRQVEACPRPEAAAAEREKGQLLQLPGRGRHPQTACRGPCPAPAAAGPTGQSRPATPRVNPSPATLQAPLLPLGRPAVIPAWMQPLPPLPCPG